MLAMYDNYAVARGLKNLANDVKYLNEYYEIDIVNDDCLVVSDKYATIDSFIELSTEYPKTSIYLANIDEYGRNCIYSEIRNGVELRELSKVEFYDICKEELGYDIARTLGEEPVTMRERLAEKVQKNASVYSDDFNEDTDYHTEVGD